MATIPLYENWSIGLIIRLGMVDIPELRGSGCREGTVPIRNITSNPQVIKQLYKWDEI